MVALDASTGEVLWRDEGANFVCQGARVEEAAVRCRVGGKVQMNKRWKRSRYRNASLTLEGFDPKTGEATWSRSLAPSVVRTEYADSSFPVPKGRVADSEMLTTVITPDGPRLVSLADGSTAEVDPTDGYLCEAEADLHYPTDSTGTFATHRSRRIVEPCTASGRPTKRAPSAPALVMGAAEADDGIYLYATEDSIVATRVAER